MSDNLGECIICETMNDKDNEFCSFCEEELVCVDKRRRLFNALGEFFIYLIGLGSLMYVVVSLATNLI